MTKFVLTMHIEADDEDGITEQDIRDALYYAGGDVPFRFEITSITETPEV